METWLRNMEGQMKDELALKSTLEEKKAQLQTYKVREPQKAWSATKGFLL